MVFYFSILHSSHALHEHPRMCAFRFALNTLTAAAKESAMTAMISAITTLWMATIIIADGPCNCDKGHGADKAGSNSQCLQRWLECRIHEKGTQKSEHCSAMTHQYLKTRIFNGNAIQGCQPLRSQDTGQRQQVDDADEYQQGIDDSSHVLAPSMWQHYNSARRPRRCMAQIMVNYP